MCPGSSSPPPCPPPGAADRGFRGLAEESIDALLLCAVPGDARVVRAACIQALGRGRVDDAVSTLEGIFADPLEDPLVVMAAARALSQILENNHVTEATINAAAFEAIKYLSPLSPGGS